MKKATVSVLYTQTTAWLITICFFCYIKGHTQIRCSLGDPVFVENFGSGISRLGPSLNQDPNTNVHPNFRPANLYNYVGGTGSVGQGDYGIMKNPKNATPGGAPWNDSFTDHTGNRNGYLYYCDAIEALNVFYAQKINGLCSDIEYELSAWFAKTNPPNSTINPNIKMIIGFTNINDQNVGNIIEVNSGPIRVIGGQRWNRRNLVFSVPNSAENIYFMLKNNLAGRIENDLAIDDIEVRPCGPELTITDLQTNNIIGENNTLCFTDISSTAISLSANTPVSYIQQWQESFGNNIWIDITGATSNILNHTLSLNNSEYAIRLKFANNSSNFNNKSCYFLSQEINHDIVISAKPDNIIVCDNLVDNNGFNGIVQNFNLANQRQTILNGQSSMDFTVSYYLSRSDAEADINELLSPHENNLSPFIQKIYAKVISLKSGCSSPIVSFDLLVNPLPNFTVETPRVICSSNQTGITLNTFENNTSEVFTYEWMFEDGTILSNESTLENVTKPGIYSVTLTKTDGTNCSRTQNIVVQESELATITLDDIVISDISDNNTVTINTSNLGIGDYEFALDDEFSLYKSDPLFGNLSTGAHTLFIKDKNGCGTRSIDISVIGFPKFFTPNGDGINDYWQIDGINDQFQANGEIFIFNRYGKLLKQLNINSQGWDGKYNGAILASDEYWFKVVLDNGRTFTNHLTLKR